MNRKLQLQNFIQKLTGSLSLSDFKKLVKEAERTIPGFLGEVENWPKEEKQLAEKIFKDVFYKRLNICKTFRYDWEAGRILPDDEELKYLKEFSKTFSFVIKFFEEEKKQNPSNADGFERVKNEYKKDKEAICQLIKNDEYRRKAEEKLREENKKKGGDSPSSPQLSDADKQIASLQGKIQVLEDKLKQTPDSDNSDASQQQKREIKRQIQQLENELKEKEKEKNNTQKGNDFPWIPVIIGGGVVIVILLIVIVLLIRKIKN